MPPRIPKMSVLRMYYQKNKHSNIKLYQSMVNFLKKNTSLEVKFTKERKYLPSLNMRLVITQFINWKYKDSSKVPASPG